MKLTKLIIAISELWNEKQLSFVKQCLLKGIDQINKKIPITDLIEHLKNETQSETYEVEILVNVTKVGLINTIKNSTNFESVFLLYVGPISVPWGNWLLCDGIASAQDVLHAISDLHFKLVVATMSPSDDWLAAEKKHGDSLTLCSYNLVEDCDPLILGLSDYAENVCSQANITPCAIKRPSSMSFLKTAEPSVCGFLDKSSSAMPCLVLIDGFTMLFNVGYGRNPEMRHQLKYIAQVDAALLSHTSYTNILALSCSANDQDSVKINHLFLPPGLSVHEGKEISNEYCQENPFMVDLSHELAKVMHGYGDRGTSVSHLAIKGKTGSPVTATQLKPHQLYHKIGFGSLELIPLGPFDEDVDVKKWVEDLRRGKYQNETLARSFPASVSVLLLWRPFSAKLPVKRFLYIGPRSPLRKSLPAVVAALLSVHECLKHSNSLSGDAVSTKKPTTARKSLGTAKAPPSTTAATKLNGGAVQSSTVADKTPRPATASEATKRQPTGQTMPGSDKVTQRPATAHVAGTAQKSKDAPQPSLAKKTGTKLETGKLNETKKTEISKVEAGKGHDTKKADMIKTEPGKTHDLKKPETTKIHDIKKSDPGKVHDTKKIDSTKKTESAKTALSKKVNEPGNGHDTKKVPQKVATKTDSKVTAEHTVQSVKDDDKTEEHLVLEQIPVINGDNCQEDAGLIHDDPDPGKLLVSVGTVECAITEHGEADFCDDTPEEYSAEQMKEMGLYDEDEDRSSAPVSGGDVPSDMSHLPMEGSIYEKNDITNDCADKDHQGQWTEPLGMPMPQNKDNSTGAKKPTKIINPIYVDCMCVPCDLDKEDLRCLFSCVRFRTGFLQLEKCSDMSRVLELMMEEWSVAGDGDTTTTTVLPSLDDEDTVDWIQDNEARLLSAGIKVAPALCRCSILIGGERGDDACLGFRCDL